MTGICAGMTESTAWNTCMPPGPSASKKAILGLKAQTYGTVASIIAWQKRTTACSFGNFCKEAGKRSYSGSSPTQSKVFCWREAATNFSTKFMMISLVNQQSPLRSQQGTRKGYPGVRCWSTHIASNGCRPSFDWWRTCKHTSCARFDCWYTCSTQGAFFWLVGVSGYAEQGVTGNRKLLGCDATTAVNHDLDA